MTVVALDIGGTWTRVAAGGVPVARFATDPDYDRQLATLIAAVGPLRPAATGVSFGGRVSAGGEVRTALNLRSYEGRALGRDLRDALGGPVRVAHDATCGLLGECGSPRGALRGIDRCGYLTLSTGIGAAIRLGGEAGFIALTTEAGHQLVPGNDQRCECGQTGCLETLVGGRALSRRLGLALEDLQDEDFWVGYARRLAPGIANFALAAGLRAVALGGAVALRRTELWAPLWTELARVATYQPVRVVPARLGEDAPLAGAALLVDLPPSSILH